MLVSTWSKKFRKTAVIKQGDKVTGSKWVATEPFQIGINIEAIESVTCIGVASTSDHQITYTIDGDETNYALDYFYYEVRMMSGDKFDVHSIPGTEYTNVKELD